MSSDELDEVLSSSARLKIVDSLSVRPRTLSELSDLTGISVQGVIKHLRRLATAGAVREVRLPRESVKARVAYATGDKVFGDFSVQDMRAVKVTNQRKEGRLARSPGDLESLSVDIIIGRRRIREQVRRLSGSIDNLMEQQQALADTLRVADLDEDSRLILGVLFTEETVEEGKSALSKYYGMRDRRSIDKALAEAKRIAG